MEQPCFPPLIYPRSNMVRLDVYVAHQRYVKPVSDMGDARRLPPVADDLVCFPSIVLPAWRGKS